MWTRAAASLRALCEVQGREPCSCQISPRHCIPLARNDFFSLKCPLPTESFEADWQPELAPSLMSPVPSHQCSMATPCLKLLKKARQAAGSFI